ncbi:MAG TPA: sialidase family protein [Longimicrobium sp.]
MAPHITVPVPADAVRLARRRRWRWGALAVCTLMLGAGLTRRCPQGEWSRPVEVWSGGTAGPGDTLQIDFRPALAAGARAAYAVGTIGTAMAKPAPEPLLARQIGGGSLGSPEGGRTFVHPRAAVDGAGILHMLWAESDPSGAPAAGPGRPRLSRLMYGRYARGEWSRAETVYTGLPLWHTANNSDLLIGDDGLHAAFVAVRPGTGPVLVHLRSSATGWRATEINRDSAYAAGPARGGAYPRLAVGGGGRVYLAFVAAARTAAGPQAPNANSVFLMRSGDGGASWSRPVLVSYSGQDQATDPQLLAAGGDTLHLLWGKNLHGGVWAEVVWHAFSADGGATWTAPVEVGVPGHAGQLHNLRATMAPAGRLHLAFRASGHGLADDARAGIYHATWSGAWSSLQRVDVASGAAGFDLAADGEGRLHLLWQATGPGGLRSLLHSVHPPCDQSG